MSLLPPIPGMGGTRDREWLFVSWFLEQVFQGVFAEPGGEVVFVSQGQRNAPDAVLDAAQADLAFAVAPFPAYPDNHKAGAHVPALHPDDIAGLKRGRHAIETRATGGNIQSLNVLRKHLALAIQSPEPDGKRHGQARFATVAHPLMLSRRLSCGRSFVGRKGSLW